MTFPSRRQLFGAIGFITTSLLFPHTSLAAENEQKPLSPGEFKEQENWRDAMSRLEHPKKGCFISTYPERGWKEVACVKAPDIPMPPRQGPAPLVIGNSNDIAARVPAGSFINSTTGSFENLSNVTTIQGPVANAGASITNAFSLQINTNFFASTACAGSPNPSCQGWEQFVYFSNGAAASAFMQYWLIKYNATCPAGQSWNQFSFTGSTDIYCWKNNVGGAVSVPVQTAANLAQLTMTGTATATGDSVRVNSGANMYSTPGDNAVNAAGGWNTAEFNLFGAGGNSAGGGQASFNANAALNVRTRVNYGGTAAPVCIATGFTAETNNLNFGPTAPAMSGPGPAVIFRQSSGGGAATNCAASTSVGDTHLTTLSGLMYDFQATGDFLLLQAESDFVVQARQISGKPNWPDASVNEAIATQMGENTIAVCKDEPHIVVNGRPEDISEGKPLVLQDNTQIIRNGDDYWIRSAVGDWVKTTIHPTHIDASVGLGTWPMKARGLLVNAKNDPNLLETSEGRILKAPFNFEDIYKPFAEGWRVDKGSLLNVCGERKERGIPSKPFYAIDLDEKMQGTAREICLAAGVKEGALLDACMIDVAFTGDKNAAKVHAQQAEPVVVGIIR